MVHGQPGSVKAVPKAIPLRCSLPHDTTDLEPHKRHIDGYVFSTMEFRE